MKRVALFLSIFSLTLLSHALPSSSNNPQKWKLVWEDEFNAANGSPIDPKKWSADIGGSGWGNNELQYYTDRPINSFQSEGFLNIKVLKEQFTGSNSVTRDYTSARLITKKTFTTTYGRIEARIKVPQGQGIWPAFWMLGNDIDKVGWPRCGEIDIMENIGKEPSMIHGTVHGPGYSGAKGITSSYSLNQKKFADDFHVFAVEWEPDAIRFYCDDAHYKTITTRDLPEGTKWVYDHPHFILLNVAVGGNWPGNPDATTTFPQTMLVDYVRVYERRP